MNLSFLTNEITNLCALHSYGQGSRQMSYTLISLKKGIVNLNDQVLYMFKYPHHISGYIYLLFIRSYSLEGCLHFSHYQGNITVVYAYNYLT